MKNKIIPISAYNTLRILYRNALNHRALSIQHEKQFSNRQVHQPHFLYMKLVFFRVCMRGSIFYTYLLYMYVGDKNKRTFKWWLFDIWLTYIYAWWCIFLYKTYSPLRVYVHIVRIKKKKKRKSITYPGIFYHHLRYLCGNKNRDEEIIEIVERYDVWWRRILPSRGAIHFYFWYKICTW